MTTPITAWFPRSVPRKGLWRVARIAKQDNHQRIIEELKKSNRKLRWFRSYSAACRCAERENCLEVVTKPAWDGLIEGLCNCSSCVRSRLRDGLEYWRGRGYSI